MSRPAQIVATVYRRIFSVRNFAALAAIPALIAAAHLVTVKPGDTLSAIAQRYCHTQADWTGTWSVSHKAGMIGSNPDLIYPGQKVAVTCKTVSVPSYHPVTVAAVQQAAVQHAVTSAPVTSVTAHPVSAGGGHLTFSGLENLWVDGGGPAWAEYTAAQVAECESGGNQWATNPSSGAAGYWQILGAPQGWTGSTDWYIPIVNAEAAVAKFEQSGDTWAQWVCK